MVELNKQFDVNGPLGFHITGHLLALVGLIVACFAITGYITFRDNSINGKALKHGTIPGSALADSNVNFEQVQLDGLSWGDESGAGTGRPHLRYTSGFYVAGATTIANNVRFLTSSIAGDQTIPNRVTIPAGAWVTKAILTNVTVMAAAAPATFDIGIQNVANATPGRDNSIYDGTGLNVPGAVGAAGLETVVVSFEGAGASVVGQGGAAVFPSSIQTFDQFVTVTTLDNNVTSGTMRLDIWYMQRD